MLLQILSNMHLMIGDNGYESIITSLDNTQPNVSAPVKLHAMDNMRFAKCRISLQTENGCITLHTMCESAHIDMNLRLIGGGGGSQQFQDGVQRITLSLGVPSHPRLRPSLTHHEFFMSWDPVKEESSSFQQFKPTPSKSVGVPLHIYRFGGTKISVSKLRRSLRGSR